jgi:serine/threonine protein kinase
MQRLRGRITPGHHAPAEAGPKQDFRKQDLLGPEDKLIGQTIVGRYEIRKKLGEGGMGAVYEAYDGKEKRRVAFKVIDERLTNRPEMLERFMREARAAAMVVHPNVIDIFDNAYFGTKAYMAMEYLEGSDLTKALRPRKDGSKSPLTWERAKPIMMQVCDALAAAHEMNILHRDLKPANIFIIKRDGRDFVKVLDFGLAKLMESDETQLTMTGYFLGTPSYGSPEQALGAKDLDQRADIYSLGVVMFELLTGRVPFKGDNAQQTLQMHINTPPPRPSELNPAISEDVEEVILRALAKKPAERFQTIREMKDAISRSHTERSAEIPGGSSDEFNQGAYETSGDESPSISGPAILEESESRRRGPDSEEDVESYLRKNQKRSPFAGIAKAAIALAAAGAITYFGYQNRGRIHSAVREYQSHSSPAHPTSPPAPGSSAPEAVETGRHIDITVTPAGLQVFVPRKGTHGGRYLGTTPLQNVRLDAGEDELVIWNRRTPMYVHLASGQTTVSGPFRAGGGSVRPRRPAERPQPETDQVQDDIPNDQEQQ